MLRAILEEKNISMYRLEKSSNISHATLSDLLNEKTKAENCSSSLIKEISSCLNMSMDNLYDQLTYKDLSSITFDKQFDLFRSNIAHELHSVQYKTFLNKYLTSNEIEKMFNNKKQKEALYLVSLIDYLCEVHNLPIPSKFDDIRNYKLDTYCVPESLYRLMETKQITFSSIYKEAIPSFKEHNIIEAEIENVI